MRLFCFLQIQHCHFLDTYAPHEFITNFISKKDFNKLKIMRIK
jgi:hypothetical protein